MSTSEKLILLQRLTGIIALGLITLQIYLGANRKLIWLHKINGILAYSFIFLHPILYLLSRKIIFGRFDFYYVFVDVCLLCDKPYDYLINFGRLGFLSITIAVLAVKFRNISDWLKANWRKLHVLNYLAFYFVSIHSITIGTDSRSTWFLVYFAVCQLIVLISIINRLRTLNFVAKLKNNLNQ